MRRAGHLRFAIVTAQRKGKRLLTQAQAEVLRGWPLDVGEQ